MASFLFLPGSDFDQVLVSTRPDIFLLLDLLLLEPLGGGPEVPTVSLRQFLLDLIPERVLEVVLARPWIDQVLLLMETRFGRVEWNMLPWVIDLLSKGRLRFILSRTNICQLVVYIFKPLT